MTKEEKLQEAQRLYKTANADQRYVLESLFPELAESEDERIRKEILEFVTIVADSKSNKMEWIAWLEKQAPKPKWSEEDEKCIDNCCLLIGAADNCYEKTFKDDCIHYLQSLKERMGV